MAIPPSSPSVTLSWCFHLLATWRRTRTASRVTSVPIPSPGSTSTFRFMKWLLRRRAYGLSDLVNERDDLLVHQALLASVRSLRKALVQFLKLGLIQVEAEILGALIQRVTSGVLAKHELAFGYAHAARVDDFVGGFFLEIAVLVNAGFVRERVPSHDRLIGLRSESDDRSEQLAGGVKMFGVDAGQVGVGVAAGLEYHHDFFERTVPGPFADAVDDALDLPGAGFDRGQ